MKRGGHTGRAASNHQNVHVFGPSHKPDHAWATRAVERDELAMDDSRTLTHHSAAPGVALNKLVKTLEGGR